MTDTLPKLIAIAGPTASGKTDFSIELAKVSNGEVVSADSRQVYSGLDIGSAKITQEEMQSVPHFLLDVATPGTTYTLGEFQDDAFEAIGDIIKRGNTPFLVGGTALYLYAVIDNYRLPRVAPNPTLRTKLEQQSPEELFAHLQTIDPNTAEIIDAQNPRRLIRAIEVVEATGKSFVEQKKQGPPKYDVLKLAPYHERDKLYQRIDTRTDARIPGIIEEIKTLLEQGVDPEWLISLGLEYRFITQFIQGDISSLEEATEQLKHAIHAFTRRQFTWFNKDEEINWVKDTKAAEQLISKFLQ